MEALLAFDREHIWHPYTSMIDPLPVYPVRSAKGVELELEDGRRLVDGMSSWWCAVHGYNHPVLNAAITDQLKDMSHVMFGGITHRPAINLCQRLVKLSPAGLDKVFLCDSGSVSVEVAIKMAFQYWISLAKPEKSRLMTIKKGYHGDTFGAMSVCDPVGGMHHIFEQVLPKHIFVERPISRYGEGLSPDDEANLERAFSAHHQEVAAFILEPIVQGAGGMRMYDPAFLAKVRVLCKKYNVLLIADEIATNFGRTGKLFACEHAAISPDIMCLGKALTGGMMTMAATLCTTEIAETISHGEAGVFMHGPTFMGNPLACSVAIASIDLLASMKWEKRVKTIEMTLEEQLRPLEAHQRVKEVRVLGAIGVVECQEPIAVGNIQKHFVAEGVWIRPFRNLIYVMPPFISSRGDLTKLCQAIASSLSNPNHFQLS